MKIAIRYLSLLILFSAVISCTKEKDSQKSIVPVYVDFAPGSYWVYQQFIVDSSGNATPTEKYDSCYVVSDTLINDKVYVKYFKPVPFEGPGQSPFEYMRDSSGYVVTPAGTILFASNDFQTVFDSHYNVLPESQDTLFQVIVKMEDKDFSVTVPAGSFITSDYRTTYRMFPIWSVSGSVRYLHSRYSANVGVIEETLPFYASNPNYVERRLARYHLTSYLPD